MEAHVTDRSQSFRLRQRAEEAQIRHGQEARVDLPHVRVTASAAAPTFRWLRRAEPHGEVFFCNMGRIAIREVLSTGDGEPLPTSVILDGLEVPEAGNYNLRNVLVRSNGDLRLIIDEQTQVERATWDTDAVLL
jgi:hypothetical protein